MPTPLVGIASAAVVALGGVGVGSMMLHSGGTSHDAASKVPLLAPDPTGRPAHSRFVYTPPQAQTVASGATGRSRARLPTPAPRRGEGSAYVPHGQPAAPLGRAPAAPGERSEANAGRSTCPAAICSSPTRGSRCRRIKASGRRSAARAPPALPDAGSPPPPRPVSLHGASRGCCTWRRTEASR